MSYLAALEHTAPTGAAPIPSAELAAALEELPDWASTFDLRGEVVDRLRALGTPDPEPVIAEMLRSYTGRLVAAVIAGGPLPEPIGDVIDRVRRQAAADRAERAALEPVAAELLQELRAVLRRAQSFAAGELAARVQELEADHAQGEGDHRPARLEESAGGRSGQP